MKRFLLKAEVHVLDEKAGIAEYIASDQTIDSDREIVKASGWRFDQFQKNSPFVDSHNYSSIEYKLGEVVDWKIDGDRLIETVQWITGVPEHRLATIGWKMTVAKMPPACSVGFLPLTAVNRGSGKAWQDACASVGQDATKTTAVRICLAQQQKELSAVILGANPNAVAKCYKLGALTDEDLETISNEHAKRETANATDDPADVAKARQRAQTAFLLGLKTITNKL